MVIKNAKPMKTSNHVAIGCNQNAAACVSEPPAIAFGEGVDPHKLS
jgi:hypothetical protein